MMYASPGPDEPLTQANVIDGCPLFGLDDLSDLPSGPLRWTERVVVLSQACDLAQTKTTKIVVAVLQPAQKLVDRGILKAASIRDQVRRGLAFGWYFLPTAPSPISLPESILDLRDLHTVSRTVLERLIADGKRVCRILTPYREHLAQHFAVTYMRIGLPAPYESDA